MACTAYDDDCAARHGAIGASLPDGYVRDYRNIMMHCKALRRNRHVFAGLRSMGHEGSCPRLLSCACAYRRVVVFGGGRPAGSHNFAEIYEPDSDEWTAVRVHLPQIRLLYVL